MIPTHAILEIVQRAEIGDSKKQILRLLMELIHDEDEGLGIDPRDWVEEFCTENNLDMATRVVLHTLAEEAVENAGRPDDPTVE